MCPHCLSYEVLVTNVKLFCAINGFGDKQERIWLRLECSDCNKTHAYSRPVNIDTLDLCPVTIERAFAMLEGVPK